MPARSASRRHVAAASVLRLGAAVLGVLAFTGCGADAGVSTSPSASQTVAASPSPSPSPTHPVALEAPPAGTLLFRQFSSDESINGFGLDSVRTDGTGLRLGITHPPKNANDQSYSWSPDGRQIVFARQVGNDVDGSSVEILRVARTGGTTTVLTPGHRLTPLTAPKLGRDGSPAFSPDGRTIAFEHEDGDFDGNALARSNIWVMDTDGGHRRQVTHLLSQSKLITGIAWSPDGSRFVYSLADEAENSALWVVNGDGSGNRQLTPITLGAGGTPDWNAAAGLILFRAVASEDNGVGNLFTIRPDGSGLRQVTRFTGQGISHNVSFSPDGTWVTSSTGLGDGPADIFVEKLDGSQFRFVLHTPEPETGPHWSPVP